MSPVAALALLCLADCAGGDRRADGLQMSNLRTGTESAIVVVNGADAPYVLLPIQDAAPERKVVVAPGDSLMQFDVRLAVDSVEYYIPVKGVRSLTVKGDSLGSAAAWHQAMTATSTWTPQAEQWRPLYHHAPEYGWMNDPNGMYYHNGVWHLYYQWGPFGSVWGNLSWGHATSTDLVHWTEQTAPLIRDRDGHVFSGSCVVDHNNTAGYGPDAVIAYYTVASDKQLQAMAYSTDGGLTFTRYDHNPALTPFDGLGDFRDPKVFRFEPRGKWIMALAADKNYRYYESDDLKAWHYNGEWGQDCGAQPSQYECPDLFELPVDGDTTRMKWVQIANINPGFVYGGSGTEYYVGNFDGKMFRGEDKPEVTKWMDFGKDHYAAVTFSGTGRRVVAMPWMSNWQYAQIVPTRQFRSANGLPRDLSLFTAPDGGIYLASQPSPEVDKLRGQPNDLGNIELNGGNDLAQLLPDNNGACEMTFTITPASAGQTTLTFDNGAGEDVKITFDMPARQLIVDRANSSKRCRGLAGYADQVKAPLALCQDATYDVRLFFDRSSLEVFVDGGRLAITSLLFPERPFNALNINALANGGAALANLANVKVFPLGCR